MTEEKVRQVLRDFGVTGKEAEIYIFLAKHGALKGGEISRLAKTHKALVYRILASLESKGLVTPTLEAPARFTAVNFETVIDLNINAKREEAARLENTKRELLSYWKNISVGAVEPALEKFTVIEGSHKIYPRISRMVKEAERQLSVVATVPGLMRAEKYGVLEAVFDHPSRSKMRFRFLTELNEQNLTDVKALLKRALEAGFDFRGRNPALGLSLFPRMVIRDREETIFFIAPADSEYAAEKDEVCLWTNSKALIQAFTVVFEDLWSNATDIVAKLGATIESGISTSKSYTVAEEESARNKYSAVMNSAEKEVVIMTSSKGVIACARSITLLKQLAKKGVALKIMAPIVNENLEAAEQLSKNHFVRHVPVSYLGTTIIDGKHLFQFKNPDPEQEETGAWPNFGNTYYSDDSRYIGRILTMLNNIWKDSVVPSAATLESFLGSSSVPVSTSRSGKETNGRSLVRFGGKQKDFDKSAPSKMISARRSTGSALIRPPEYFNMPDMVIEVHHYQKLPFGGGNNLEVYLRLETPKGLKYIPVAVLETNPHPEILLNLKKIYAGTPAAQNIQLVKPEQLQAHLTGKNFFAGWTVPILLPQTSKSLPPSCILFEGYGSVANRTYSWPFPSGFKVMIDWTGFDAFVTFLDPTWKYAGPGTQGRIGIDVAVTGIPPIDN